MSRIIIGTANGKNIGFDLDVLLPTRLLITADSGGGKSWLIRALCEQLFGKVQTIIIDVEGEFASLREQFAYVLVGKGGETPADTRSAGLLAKRLLELRASAVCDIYEMKPADRHCWVQLFLEGLIEAPKELRNPCVVIVDEAHIFCPEHGKGESIASAAMIDLCTRGRKRFLCAVWATQRLATVNKDASSMLLNRLVGPTFEDVNLKRAAEMLSIPSGKEQQQFYKEMKLLEPGSFYALGRAIAKERTLVHVRDVVTSHPKAFERHATPPPPAPDKIKALLPKLADLPKEAEDKARTEAEYKREIRELKTQLSAASRQPAAKAAATAIAKVDPAQVRLQAEKLLGVALRKRDASWIRALNEFKRDVARQLASVTVVVPFKAPQDVPAIETPTTVTHLVRPTPVPAVSRASRPERELPSADGEFKPSPLHKKVCGILAAYYPEPIDKALLASMCGKSLGGGWNGRLSELRQAGLLEDLDGGGPRATAECARQYAGAFDPPKNTEEAIAVWDHKLSETHRAILNRLIEADGEPVAKADLAEAAGKSLGGGFNGRLSELRSTGLMLDAGRGFFKANKRALFLNGEAA